MLAKWLSNDVPKFSTILCSAGMMVPWLLIDRAAAHDFDNKEYDVGTDCVFPNRLQAEGSALRRLRDICSQAGGTLTSNRAWNGQCLKKNPETGKNEYKYWGAGWGRCKIPAGQHTHGQYTEEDCDCGNCGDGCDS